MTTTRRYLIAAALLLHTLWLPGCQPRPPASWLIGNVTIVDGTGDPARPGAVRIATGRIAAIGALAPLDGETVVDGGGRVLAPGFIDTHSHADEALADRPEALAAVSQGITTVVVGQDGSSPYPLEAFFAALERAPAAVNIAAYAGHNTLREQVMAEDFRRPADADEVAAMRSLLEREMAAGALGLSTGLEDDPGIYSMPGEVLALAQTAADRGGRYISHVRSEDRRFEQALEELLEIGRITGMPVQISHIKLAMRSLWGESGRILARLDAARQRGIDVSADLYPYTYWQSDLMVLLPERDPADRSAVEFALREIAPPDGLWLTQFDPEPDLVGKTVSEIAALRGVDPVAAYQQLAAAAQAAGSGHDMVIGTSMDERDIAVLLAWPHTNLCTDGALVDLHPRARGAYPRVLARYVREQGLLSLEAAVHKMTGLAAGHMGFVDRGVIREGAAADLVLFDPATITDRATPEEPTAMAEGIIAVWVNGEAVYRDGAATGARPGEVLRRRPR